MLVRIPVGKFEESERFEAPWSGPLILGGCTKRWVLWFHGLDIRKIKHAL
jgi:hypothetical protein